ncbi:MAG: HEAT repeat domain-containing protein [Gemmataceae bacterium]|nr:HEAT repeat domain-containing protein [Gemmataceae bacterium]
MAWLKWRGALVLGLLGSVGLAWSQSPRFNSPAQTAAAERVMTVHENGKALRSRVITSWRMANGALAHQLQVIDSGEMLTIVEDGQPMMVSQGANTQVRALPMRIFHWGLRNRTPPPGVPAPPHLIETVSARPAGSSVIQASGSQLITAASVGDCSVCNQCVTGRGPRRVGCTDCRERIITWEEGPGRPVTLHPGSIAPAGQTVSPAIVHGAKMAGHTQAADGPPTPGAVPTVGTVPVPGAAPAPIVPQVRPATHPRGGAVVIVPGKSTSSGIANVGTTPSPTIVQSGPITLRPGQTTTGQPSTKTPTIQSADAKPAGVKDPPPLIQEKPARTTAKSPVRDRLNNLLHKSGAAPAGLPHLPPPPQAAKKDATKPSTLAKPSTLPITAAKNNELKPATLPAAKKDHKKPTMLPPPAVAKKEQLKPATLPGAAKKDDKRPTTLPPATAAKKNQTKPATLPAAAKKADKKLPAPAVAAKREVRKPFSTATAQATATPRTSPLVMPSDVEQVRQEAKSGAKNDAVKPAATKQDGADWRKMWGKRGDGTVEQPGLATLDREKIRKDVPPASETAGKGRDILMAPEKFNPAGEKANPNISAEMANLYLQQPAGNVPTPLGVQSVLAARNGAPGPVQYIPVPVATVPEPIRPPTPPEPTLPQPPNPTAYLNAFSPPPAPGGQQAPPLTPEQMHVIMQHQAFIQQQAYMQQMAMMQRQQYAQMAQLVPVGNGMPMQVRYPANYNGPQAPNPVAQQQPPFPIQQAGFVPPAHMAQAHMAGNPAMDRRVIPAALQQPAASDSNTLAQLINVLQQSPYPAQREWAATNLSTFDSRANPHLTQVLVQAARQDAAPAVRAASIYSLSRLNVHSEPVLGTLQALRGDADPRVRQEVEQAYVRMGLTPGQP